MFSRMNKILQNKFGSTISREALRGKISAVGLEFSEAAQTPIGSNVISATIMGIVTSAITFAYTKKNIRTLA